jgi:hypothetical protein
MAAVIVTTIGADKPKRSLEIRAVAHSATESAAFVMPGRTRTKCNESGSDCQTKVTPSQTYTSVFITNIVEANGLRYKIACTAGWSGSNCSEMMDGDVYSAELQATTMWVKVRRGGNQGKQMRVKYKVLDIRPISH